MSSMKLIKTNDMNNEFDAFFIKKIYFYCQIFVLKKSSIQT